ncbi:hypothetical protein [Phyllobacterium sp. SB3]|uniref:hypothetical protein n=1 Tax=Phyllobacterium sp. SB3 TaxID=3156073 RepID=UPI0032AF539B
MTNTAINIHPLPQASPTPCIVGSLAKQASNLISAYNAADEGNDSFKDAVMENAAKSLGAMEATANSLVASCPEGAMFQLCSLLCHSVVLPGLIDSDLEARGWEWMDRLEKGLNGLLAFMEQHFEIDRTDFNFEYYAPRVLSDRLLPQVQS